MLLCLESAIDTLMKVVVKVDLDAGTTNQVALLLGVELTLILVRECLVVKFVSGGLGPHLAHFEVLLELLGRLLHLDGAVVA